MVSLHWVPPQGWHCYSRAELEEPAWRASVPPAEPGSSYDAELDRFVEWALGQRASRTGWLLVLNPDGLEPGVVAFGSLDVRPGPDLDTLERQVEAAPLADHLMSRELSRIEVGGSPLLLCHELSARGAGPEGARLEERGIAIRHVADRGVNVAVDLLTTDLLGFEQIATSAAHACASVELRFEGAPA